MRLGSTFHQIENLQNLSNALMANPYLMFGEARSACRRIGKLDLDDEAFKQKYGEDSLNICLAMENIKNNERLASQMQEGNQPDEEDEGPPPAQRDAELLLQFDADRPTGIHQLCRDAGIRTNSYYKLLAAVKRQYGGD